MATSCSMPDLPAPIDHGTKSSSTTTLSSNNTNNNNNNNCSSNGNQISSDSSNGSSGKHVVLALESYNQIDGSNVKSKVDGNEELKMKIKLNIDPTSSSSASSVNLDMNSIGDIIVTDISTL